MSGRKYTLDELLALLHAVVRDKHFRAEGTDAPDIPDENWARICDKVIPGMLLKILRETGELDSSKLIPDACLTAMILAYVIGYIMDYYAPEDSDPDLEDELSSRLKELLVILRPTIVWNTEPFIVTNVPCDCGCGTKTALVLSPRERDFEEEDLDVYTRTHDQVVGKPDPPTVYHYGNLGPIASDVTIYYGQHPECYSKSCPDFKPPEGFILNGEDMTVAPEDLVRH